MKIRNFLLLVALCFIGITRAQSYHFEHYSTEDGLPQYTIMQILQDRKGFMWFATWDGFSKFNGHTFKNYKVQAGDDYYMKSNRIEDMHEDKYGNIWLLSYDGEAHCFNPATETFRDVRSIPGYENYPFLLSHIETKPSGKVWLLSDENGAFCITDSLFTAKIYSIDAGNLKGNTVHAVFEEDNSNSWLLTDNGICLQQQDTIIHYFFENKTDDGSQAFFTAQKVGDEIWFGSQKGRIWRYSKSTDKFTLLETPTFNNITGFQLISEKEVAISTLNDGFLVFNIDDNSFAYYRQSTNEVLKNNNVRFIHLDSLGQLWFETDELGIYKFDTGTKKIKYFFVKSDDVALSSFPPKTMIIEDIHHQIWVHPRGGGFSRYNKEKDNLEPFYNDESSADFRFSNILHAAYSDKQGNLWLSTRSHGVEKVIFDRNYFKLITINPEDRISIANDVRAVLQDKDKNIWVATKNRQLTIYDELYNRIGTFAADGTIKPNQLFPGAIYSMMEDDKGNIWIGTKGEGLFKIRKIQQGRYHVEQFRKDANDIHSLSEDVVYSIYQDSRKNIWIGTYGNGLNLVNTLPNGKTVFINHRNNLKNYPIETGYRIRFITENKYGNICVGTTAGLIMFSSVFNLPDDIKYRYYSRVPGDKESLANNDVHGICATKQGEMFLATFGGGLNKVIEYDTQGFPAKFKAYTVNNGLPSDVCLAVIEDNEGKLWISLENSLSKFDPQKEEFETFVEIKRLMTHNNFSEASVCRLVNNDIIFGTSNGILTFTPYDIKNDYFEPYIALSDFRLFNQSVNIGDKGSPLTMNINNMPKLKLGHKQNFFSIEYAALDFIDSDNILYAYQLEGFDQDWIYAQKQRVANYTNIPKGDYVFKVKSTNNEGLWMDNERVLPIKVLPSFWETPWAYILYILFFLLLVYLSVRILFSFYKLKNNVEVEKQMSEMKLRFFTDISHEIRTPLTMISSPIDYLLTENDTSEKVKTQLNMVSQNINRLLRLVNQILDFRKVQHFQLKIQETEFGLFIKGICHNFDETARNNNIEYSFTNEAEGESIWVDRDCLEKIVMNLLSNAFKYTPNGKSIQVTVRNSDKYLSVEVKDSGKGISKERQRTLFTRFASFNEDKNKPSTGIGLFIVNDLVNKHAGKIIVESEAGVGSSFMVMMQKGLNHFGRNVEVIPSVKIQEEQLIPVALPENDIVEITESDNEKKSILIVEDDADLRSFIKTILNEEYIVHEAEDGVFGLQKAEQLHPDFIVSDIMMPNMDGIQLLQKLKENINTSHIPVILLTAKTTIESKLDGLSYGADDYITKPFSVPYFRARIHNLLEQRKRLQEIYRSQLTSTSATEYEPQPFIITSHDEVLMKNLVELIEENMDNSEFTVEELCTSVGMSRSVFFNKIKSLTGLAPIEFIRDIKMKRAAQLLASGKFMVKEVSFMIGISDTKYFGKCFKAKYGKTPQEYKNQFIDN